MGKTSYNYGPFAVKRMMNDFRLTVVVIGYLFTIIAIFMPWYDITIAGITVTEGLEFNVAGLLLLLGGLFGMILTINVFDINGRFAAFASLFISLIIFFIVIANYPESQLSEIITVKIGFWTAIFGTVVSTVMSAIIVFTGGTAQS